MDERRKFRIRKARKQVESKIDDNLQQEEGMGDYNIWYHKYIGKKKDPFENAVLSKTRCNIGKDSGWTKGCEKEQPFFCLYFARGCCFRGEDCHFLHRLPTQSDENGIPLTKDCFGREKHAADREDMGGIGAFNREGRTIFVRGLKNVQGIDLHTESVNHFKEFGELSYVNVKKEHCNAKIKYRNRLNAEFAKEAMTYQTLGNGEVLLITWSADEDNEMERARVIMEYRKKMVEAKNEREINTSNGNMRAITYNPEQITEEASEVFESNNETQLSTIVPPPVENLSEDSDSSKDLKKKALYQQLYSKYFKKIAPQYYKQFQQQNENLKREREKEEEKKERNIEEKKFVEKQKQLKSRKNESSKMTYENYLHTQYKKNIELQRESRNDSQEKKRKRDEIQSNIVEFYPDTNKQYEPNRKKRKIE